jgi:thioredoxin-related protein
VRRRKKKKKKVKKEVERERKVRKKRLVESWKVKEESNNILSKKKGKWKRIREDIVEG